MNNLPMGYPPCRGIFEKLPPSHFQAVVRKAQGFTDRQSGDIAGIASATVTSYVRDARIRLYFETTQEMLWAYYAEYTHDLIFPVKPLEDDEVEEES